MLKNFNRSLVSSKFIYRLLNCHNCIVKECLTVGINHYNASIGYKLDFILSRFGIHIIDTGFDVCLHDVIGTKLTLQQKTLVN